MSGVLPPVEIPHHCEKIFPNHQPMVSPTSHICQLQRVFHQPEEHAPELFHPVSLQDSQPRGQIALGHCHLLEQNHLVPPHRKVHSNPLLRPWERSTSSTMPVMQPFFPDFEQALCPNVVSSLEELRHLEFPSSLQTGDVNEPLHLPA